MFFYQFVTAGGFEVFAHHFCDQLFETDFWCPAEFLFCLGGVTEKSLDFCGAEIAVVDGYDAVSIGIKAFFLNTTPLPCDRYACLCCRYINK